MERKIVDFRCVWGMEKVSLLVAKYVQGGLYIGLAALTEDGEEPFCDMTVNLDGCRIGKNEAFINADMARDLLGFIREQELGEVLPLKERSGYCEYSLVRFDMDRLREFDPDGVREYLGMVSGNAPEGEKNMCLPDIVLLEKPGTEGLTRTEAMDLFDMLAENEACPLEIENPCGGSCAMGFITPAAAGKLGHDYSGLAESVGELMVNAALESPDLFHEFRGLKIYLGR